MSVFHLTIRMSVFSHTRVDCFGLQVDAVLHKFIEEEVLPSLRDIADTKGKGGDGHIQKSCNNNNAHAHCFSSKEFWKGFADIVCDFTPINDALLAERQRLQSQLNTWHCANPGPIKDMAVYKTFLADIGYLITESSSDERVVCSTVNVDDEVANQAGPQLVVPIINARYALNAANSRWGSLYDALYGTDVISEEGGASKFVNAAAAGGGGGGGGYNPIRGAKVQELARQFLDEAVPLLKGSHADATSYSIAYEGSMTGCSLQIKLRDESVTSLADGKKLVGFQGDPGAPSSILLVNNGLHIEIEFDRSAEKEAIRRADPAGVTDVILEAALSTILDLEDSVAAVDAEDKVVAYRNWLGIMKGTLQEEVTKGGKTFTRTLNHDRCWTAASAGAGDGAGAGTAVVTLPGRSLLFVRNVGHHMKTPAILTGDGSPIYEGMLDAVVTVLIAVHDIKRSSAQVIGNSRKGSVYIVKPKMHGPDEVKLAVQIFGRVEKMLGLTVNTVKLGIMDEERRMSVNLKAAIAVAQSRVAFINTGFLDRTGDELHTVMRGGPVMRKNDLKSCKWLAAYEKRNVLLGLACGLRCRAQIGKGMWACPDAMKAMVETKIGHPKAGANTAWVPSPTAATLHAMHYHKVNVANVQMEMERGDTFSQASALLDDLLTVPIVDLNLNSKVPSSGCWSASEIQQELDNNVQSLLGYVVRWVNQGIGCSKVLDIQGVGLMEDRATLRISSQHIANWLLHGVVSEAQVMETMHRMAGVVDSQNKGDSTYTPMSGSFETSPAFFAARELVFQSENYTESILHAWRTRVKSSSASASASL